MKKLEIWYGSLLHDIGKIIYRSQHEFSKGSHSDFGAEYLKRFPKLNEVTGIRHSIKYHHAAELNKANIQKDSIAYIVYMADNIASGLDRRDIEGLEETGSPFNKEQPLESIFNILNGNDEKLSYPFSTNEYLNYPEDIVNMVL